MSEDGGYGYDLAKLAAAGRGAQSDARERDPRALANMQTGPKEKSPYAIGVDMLQREIDNVARAVEALEVKLDPYLLPSGEEDAPEEKAAAQEPCSPLVNLLSSMSGSVIEIRRRVVGIAGRLEV